MQHGGGLTEAECYLRCYGWRGSEETVRVLPPATTAPKQPDATAERIRQALEAMIDGRDSEAA
jgi:hypothetical protein